MTLEMLQSRLKKTGHALKREGNSIAVMGDVDLSNELLKAIRFHKPALLSLLPDSLTVADLGVDTRPQIPVKTRQVSTENSEIATDTLPAEWLDQWRERVAIMVEDGRLDEEVAEAAALVDVRAQMERYEREVDGKVDICQLGDSPEATGQ